MQRFRYKATTAAGQIIHGEADAASEEELFRHLYDEGCVLLGSEAVSIKPETGKKVISGWRRKRISGTDIEGFTVDLGILIQAGFSTDRALDIQISATEHQSMSRLQTRIKERVREGVSLSKAMETEDKVFSPLYLNMVHAGEHVGDLGSTLQQLGEFMRRSREIREAVIALMIYPVILTIVLFISLAMILGFVVPRFTEMFDEAGRALPLATRVVVNAGMFVQNYWWLIIPGVAGLAWLLWRIYHDPVQRLRLDTGLLRLPVLNKFLRGIETARFSRTLGTLVGNGMPLIKGIEIARQVVGNRSIAGAIGRVAERVRQGQGLARPLLEEQALPNRAALMLQVAEESGRLAEMLLRVAELYDREVQTALQRLMAVLEPALILGMGLIVGGIVMSIVVALVDINQLGGL